MLQDSDGDSHDVCANCMVEGDISDRLRQHAEQLEQRATFYRQQADLDWQTPTPDEWARHEKTAQQWFDEREREEAAWRAGRDGVEVASGMEGESR